MYDVCICDLCFCVGVGMVVVFKVGDCELIVVFWVWLLKECWVLIL